MRHFVGYPMSLQTCFIASGAEAVKYGVNVALRPGDPNNVMNPRKIFDVDI